MPFKFEKLAVWQRALDYVDLIYDIAAKLPQDEAYNLKSQIKRAATSVALNIAEGSTGQTDAEQSRFLGMAMRSLIETIACQHIISRRNLLTDLPILRQAYRDAETLTAMLYAMRKKITPDQAWLRESPAEYLSGTEQAEGENL